MTLCRPPATRRTCAQVKLAGCRPLRLMLFRRGLSLRVNPAALSKDAALCPYLINQEMLFSRVDLARIAGRASTLAERQAGLCVPEESEFDYQANTNLKTWRE